MSDRETDLLIEAAFNADARATIAEARVSELEQALGDARREVAERVKERDAALRFAEGDNKRADYYMAKWRTARDYAEERNDECNRIQRVLNHCADERDEARRERDEARRALEDADALADGQVWRLAVDIDAAWAATGVAGTVRGLTTLADVVETQRRERDEAHAQAAVMREVLRTNAQHEHDCRLMLGHRDYNKGLRGDSPDEDECDCAVGAALTPDAGTTLLAELAALRVLRDRVARDVERVMGERDEARRERDEARHLLDETQRDKDAAERDEAMASQVDRLTAVYKAARKCQRVRRNYAMREPNTNMATVVTADMALDAALDVIKETP